MMPLKGDTENNPIVLDIGEVYTKIGVNGDLEPRAVIPTAISKPDGTLKYIFKHDHSVIMSYQPGKDFRSLVHTFISTIYSKYLQVDPKQHSVVICESLLSSTKLRQTVGDVLFKDFEVPSLIFAPHQLLACFTIGRGTALVLDCSYGESVAIPVVEWTPLLWAWHAAPAGASAIHEAVCSNMKKYGEMQSKDKEKQKIDIQLNEKTIEDIKVKTCFVTTMERSKKLLQQKLNPSNEEPHISQTIPPVTYYLDGSTKLYIPGPVREESCEVLFEQDNDRVSVCTIMLDCLLKSPVDTVKELSKNILLIGGTAMLPGFRHRLLVELNETVKCEERYREALGECEFRVHNPPTQANLVPWLGASIFGSLKEFRRKYITKDYYKKNNDRLPDWCVTNLPTPEPIHEHESLLHHQHGKHHISAAAAAYTRTSRFRKSSDIAARLLRQREEKEQRGAGGGGKKN